MQGESSEETIARVLSSYEIGKKIHALRLRKKLALVELGRHTGLSASMLSQLENGKLAPTLATLARIAMVFDVGLDHFFVDKRKTRLFQVVRKEERIRFPDRPDHPHPDYYFECLAFPIPEKMVHPYWAEFPSRERGDSGDHVHEGVEFIYVIEGTLGICYQDREHVMETGDSVYFDAGEPHSYRGIGAAARALVVTTPPEL